MKYAVFYRNLNLGRPRCPTKDMFEEAFTAAGAVDATSFLTNGTIVFSLGSRKNAASVLTAASAALRAVCGLAEPGFVRTLPHLAEFVARDPFARAELGGVFERCVSFLPNERVALPAVPLVSSRGDVEIIELTSTEAFGLSRKLGASPGSPNAFLERRLGVSMTTRSFNTVARLVEKFGE